jgi:tetratricopeptide (TPR) repeat protein
LARSERDRIYQGIYDKVIAGEITLQPHAELEVLQNMLLLYTRNGQLAEASQMFDRTFERLDQTGQMAPDVYASFLFSKARLMSSLSEREHSAEASRFIQASANALKESVANWRLCLKDALPLQERYGKFKLARTLNDFACDLRTLGQVSEAQEAIEASIQIKKANGALPHSLAISLSEYSQTLTAQGKIRQAQPINEVAQP